GVYSVCVDLQNNIYSGGNDNTIRKISSNGAEIWKYSNYKDWVLSICIDLENNIITGDRSSLIKKLQNTHTVQKVAYYS
ncbi:hypothetical protein IR151_12820, partial [Clostridioides sp. ES-S-0006-03]|nr:hypothetical protein [Clostridioides sp. ES-S-0006-03]